ncbi:MAG: thioredoxin family protein [Firmicutes bacterium]|nr:thioredoxin family protein [Bacillota bacterium]
MAIKQITAAECDQLLENTSRLVILDFWNENCAVCEALAPVLEELSAERADIEIYGVHAAKERDLTKRFVIMTAPSLVFYKDGKVQKKTIGYKSKESLTGIIDTINGSAE